MNEKSTMTNDRPIKLISYKVATSFIYMSMV
jgi:hypothetical protein